MSSLQTLPKGDSAWLFRKAIERIIQQISVLETNIGSSTTGNSSDTQVIFNDNGVLRGDAGLTYNAATDLLSVGAATITGDLTVDTSTLKVDSANDRVGVGITSPLAKLDVRQIAAAEGLKVYVNDTGATNIINFRSYDNTLGEVTRYAVACNGVATWSNVGGVAGTAMTLNSTGLGVGTSPTNKLDVSSSDAAVTLRVNTQNAGASASNYSQIQLSDVGTVRSYWRNVRDGAGTTQFAYNSYLQFLSDAAGTPTERMRLDASGRLLVGTTDSGSNSGIGLKAAYSATAPYFATVGSSNASNTYSYLLYSTTDAAFKFYVSYSGQISATSGTISAISDARLKENVQDIDVGLGAILALKPRKFDWKAGKGKDIKGDRGFIAQEFEQVFPNLIDEWKDPAPEGEAPYKSVRQDLIPVLVKAIQELTARVQTLETR